MPGSPNPGKRECYFLVTVLPLYILGIRKGCGLGGGGESGSYTPKRIVCKYL